MTVQRLETKTASQTMTRHGVRPDASERLARLFRILTLVRSKSAGRPLGREELAESCGCSVRTVQRDVDLLRASGAPLEYDPMTQAYTFPDKGWAYPIVSLTGEDALALALARGALASSGMPQPEAVRAALDKATAGLSPDLKGLLAEASRVLRAGDAIRDYSAAPMDTLIAAATAGRTVEIDYRSFQSGERAWRRVDPYQVEPREGRYWELHGWCHRRGRILTFALDRVYGARPTGGTFAVREAEWAAFAGARGVVGGLRGGLSVAVDVVFAPEVAPYALDRHWPEGLEIVGQPDGSARLTGAAQGVAGLVPEVLRWRRHARVLGGPELWAAVAEEAREIAALYGAAEKHGAAEK